MVDPVSICILFKNLGLTSFLKHFGDYLGRGALILDRHDRLVAIDRSDIKPLNSALIIRIHRLIAYDLTCSRMNELGLKNLKRFEIKETKRVLLP